MTDPTSDQERALHSLNERHGFIIAHPQADGTFTVEAWAPRHEEGYIVNEDGTVLDNETLLYDEEPTDG